MHGLCSLYCAEQQLKHSLIEIIFPSSSLNPADTWKIYMLVWFILSLWHLLLRPRGIIIPLSASWEAVSEGSQAASWAVSEGSTSLITWLRAATRQKQKAKNMCGPRKGTNNVMKSGKWKLFSSDKSGGWELLDLIKWKIRQILRVWFAFVKSQSVLRVPSLWLVSA